MIPSSISGSRRPRLADLIGAALALALLCAPAFVHLQRIARGAPAPDAGEKRALAGWPAPPASLADAAGWSEAMEAALKDRFGLRGPLSSVYGEIARDLQRPTKGVTPGRDGWLFYNRGDAMEAYRGLVRREDGWADQWIDGATRFAVEARERGAAVAMILPPNKNRVYAEFMPTWAGPPSPARPIAALLDHPRAGEAGLIDVEPAIRAAKADAQAYLRADTHWTGAGAWAAWREAAAVFASQRADLAPLPASRVGRAQAVETGGDLADALGVSDPRTDRYMTVEVIAPRDTRYAALPGDEDAPLGPFVYRSGDGSGPTLVVVGDSFFTGLRPFAVESFDTVVFIHHQSGAFDARDVWAWEPDAVLVEMVERVVDAPFAPTGLSSKP